jgi:hypothetical protein
MTTPPPSNGVANGSVTAAAMRGETLTPAELRRLQQPPQGTGFAPYERLFAQYNNGLVFAPDDWSSKRLSTALEEDGQLRSVEQVLTLPIRSATFEIVPEGDDQGQTALVRDTLTDKLPLLIQQATSAIAYRRAFFETTWTVDDRGRVVYEELGFRPASGCDPGFDPTTARPMGFRQRIVPVAGVFPPGYGWGAAGFHSDMPGWVTVPPQRAFIHVNGQHREPVKGVSDLDVGLWVHDTKKKILFLVCKFLEKQALPDVLFYADDQGQADERASAWANMGGGAMGMERLGGDTAASVFDVLDASGHGAQQFLEFLNWLDSQMTASVLAGFTDLPQAAVQGTGSYALSADQSEFFLAASQAKADELADSIRRDVFGPLVAYNYGPRAPVPRLKIGPLSSKYQQRGIDLLKSVINSRYSNVPRGVVEQLVAASATYLGLDPTRVNNAIDQAEQEMQAAQAAQAAAVANAAATGAAPGAHGAYTRDGAAGLPEPGLFPGDTAWQNTQPPTTLAPPSLSAPVRQVGMAVDTMYGLVTDQLRAQGEPVG